jgi:carbohydrate kinase (thermoresistant glucokinase family)
MVVVLMGVTGSGKTTVGRALAQSLGWAFYDADDYHPPANVAKMASGVPLTDNDRWPWLDRIVDMLGRVQANGSHAVLACSALKQTYRDRIARPGDVNFVYLKGDLATIEARSPRGATNTCLRRCCQVNSRRWRGRRRARRRHSRDVVVQVAAIRDGLQLKTASV